MKQLLLTCTIAALIPFAANAMPSGRPDGSQTVHHCGWLKASSGSYTKSNITTVIVEDKLHTLGFLRKPGRHGKYTKTDRAAVRAFQVDAGIKADGAVGPVTAGRLAYYAHPSTNVRRCYREAMPIDS